MTEAIQTAAFWDVNADRYVAVAEHFTAQFCDDVMALIEISRGTTLIDVACGPGALALAAARAGAVVTAIDFSQAMVDRLVARAGDLPIYAQQMDGQKLAFPPATFDRGCSVCGIPLFPDWRAGLRELARVLKPGGRAVIVVADNPYGFGPNQLLATVRADLFPASRVPVELTAMEVLADRDRLRAELVEAGFSAIAVHDRTHDFLLDAALMAPGHPMLTQNPVLAGLPDADRDRVIAVAIEAMGRMAEGPRLAVPGTARLAVGTKE